MKEESKGVVLSGCAVALQSKTRCYKKEKEEKKKMKVMKEEESSVCYVLQSWNHDAQEGII